MVPTILLICNVIAQAATAALFTFIRNGRISIFSVTLGVAGHSIDECNTGPNFTFVISCQVVCDTTFTQVVGVVACISPPPRISWSMSSLVVAFTSSGLARNIHSCLQMMMFSSAMAGMYASPVMEILWTIAIWGIPRVNIWACRIFVIFQIGIRES